MDFDILHWHFVSFVHCEATLLFFRHRVEIHNYLLNSILWKIFCETIDKSKIGAIFEYKFHCGTNASETVGKINSVFTEDSTSHSTVSFWFVEFPSGDFSHENEPRGRPQPEVNNDELKATVESGASQTTRELASNFGVSIPTILNHLRQINKVEKLDRWVP